jgi:feruloyl esterase
VEDFAWRAVHTEVASGKLLLQKFYNKPQSHSYYIGCSLGGRQGFRAAEMFPDDFDGILAGCPALDFNNLISWRASFYPITGPIGSPDFISNDTWISLIHNEVLAQCDGLDGVVDGIIQDPNLCNFRPEAIMCSEGQNASTSCLSPTQVEMVRKIFSPFYGVDGNVIYPAMQPGSEIMAVQKLYAGAPFSYSEDWFRYVVLNDPTWNASKFNITDAALADALNPMDIRTWPTRQLESFFRISDKTASHPVGRKLITYHGGQDNQITSFDTERFYNHLQTAMQASSAELDSYFRFFRIPGMFHCSSGPGAWVVGQAGSSSSKGLPFDPKVNVLAALVEWVERGVPPETIGGTKFVDDNVSKGVQYTRRHCRYPRRITYTGGNATLESSWACLGDTSA